MEGMDVVFRTAKDIKELRIQGARRVAEASLRAIRDLLLTLKGRSKEEIYRAVVEAARILASARPTEPAMRTVMVYAIRAVTRNEGDVEGAVRELEAFDARMKEMRRKLAEYGARRIPDGARIMTHCHSTNAVAVLRRARKEGKEIEVYVTETRPRLQGRITAKALARAGIKVYFIVDSATYYYMKDMDLYLTGADAITGDGYVVNKVGTALMALAADRFGVPYYVAASSLKFDPATLVGYEERIEHRAPEEVWRDPPEGVEILNPAFDATPPDLVDAVITQYGVFSPYVLPVVIMERERIGDVERELALLNILKKP